MNIEMNTDVYDSTKLAKFTDQLKSEEFLTYLQSRINYDIKDIKRQYFNYIEEAEFGIRLLSQVELKNKKILEVGSGAGILTSWLLLNGVNVTGIEPSAIGYDFHKDIFSAIWEYFKLPSDRVHDLSAEQLSPEKIGKFDLIFSLNVMEHIPSENLKTVFATMNSVLNDDGMMYHHCPNYMVPFEPHYGLPLVPFFPQAVGKLKGISEEGVWKSLNFINLFQVKKITKDLGLKVEFQKEVMKDTFVRLESDPVFASRHPLLLKMYTAMKNFGVNAMLGMIPPSLCTPMTFTIRK